ncbi:hypothetical protein HU200_034139 [Digitaria exilis]|uniref:Uncharacterized protein n=1 Tax=Digitaria exilis TaxID=1010633 RepID=A0A835BKJ5_9POAL|nr:hypothetical protein HU200_034139 [Digitaria exilis]
MGATSGHVEPGVVILGVGLWQLFNHMRLFSLRPDSYVAPVWFPARGVRHLELIVIIAGSIYELATQLFIGHTYFLPFDADGSIPSTRLPNHEHAVIFAALLAYASYALYLDRRATSRPVALRRSYTACCMLLLALVFAEEVLMFHFHSTGDHTGVEGQFHLFVELLAAACLAGVLLGIAFPRSFAVSLVRSACLAFQGLWLVIIGGMWVPSLVAKGCSIVHDDERDRDTVRCHTDASLHRAKALVNLLFAWCMSLLTLFVVTLYLCVSNKYSSSEEEAICYGRLPVVSSSTADEEEEDLKKAHKKCGPVQSGDDDHAHEFMSLAIEV